MAGKGYAFDDYYHGWIQSIESADIQRVAQKYFSKPGILSVVAPEKKPEPIEQENAKDSSVNDAALDESGEETTENNGQ